MSGLNCAKRPLTLLGYWVSTGRSWLVLGGIGRYWLINDGTGSVWGDTGWYLVVLGQCGAVTVGTWWNWVSIGR